MKVSSSSLETLYQTLKVKKEGLDKSSPAHSNWVSVLLVFFAVIALMSFILKLYYDFFGEDITPFVLLLSGVFFSAVAIGCYHVFNTLKEDILFVKIALHACMIVGQGFLLYGGMAWIAEEIGLLSDFTMTWVAWTWLATIATMSFFCYPVNFNRFISLFAVFITLFLSLQFQPLFGAEWTDFGLFVYLILLFLSCYRALGWSGATVKYDSVLYAPLTVLFMMVLLLENWQWLGLGRGEVFFNDSNLFIMFKFMMLVSLLWVPYQHDLMNQHKHSITGLWVGLSLLLSWFLPPTMVLALVMMVLAYQYCDKTVREYAMTGLVISIILFYYNLQLTLLAKSMVLMLSGCGLLLSRLWVYYRGFLGVRR